MNPDTAPTPSCEAVVELITFSHENLPTALRNLADFIDENRRRVYPEPHLYASYDPEDSTYSVSITGRYILDARIK